MTDPAATAWAAAVPDKLIMATPRKRKKPYHGIPGVTAPPEIPVGEAHAALAERAFALGVPVERCLLIATVRAEKGSNYGVPDRTVSILDVVPGFARAVPGMSVGLAQRVLHGNKIHPYFFADASLGCVVVPNDLIVGVHGKTLLVRDDSCQIVKLLDSVGSPYQEFISNALPYIQLFSDEMDLLVRRKAAQNVLFGCSSLYWERKIQQELTGEDFDAAVNHVYDANMARSSLRGTFTGEKFKHLRKHIIAALSPHVTRDSPVGCFIRQFAFEAATDSSHPALREAGAAILAAGAAADDAAVPPTPSTT